MINHSHGSVWLGLKIIKIIQHYIYASHCLHFPHFYLRSEPFQPKERKIITQSSFYQTMAAAIQSVLLKRATSHFLSCIRRTIRLRNTHQSQSVPRSCLVPFLSETRQYFPLSTISFLIYFYLFVILRKYMCFFFSIFTKIIMGLISYWSLMNVILAYP